MGKNERNVLLTVQEAVQTMEKEGRKHEQQRTHLIARL